MIQMEEGDKENIIEKVKFVDVVAICNDRVDGIIVDEELQNEVIIPEMYLPQDQSNANISTMPDSENICQKIISDIIENITDEDNDSKVFCQSILLDILDQIEKSPPCPHHVAGTNHQIINDIQNPDEILLIQVEEIIVQQFPSMTSITFFMKVSKI